MVLNNTFILFCIYMYTCIFIFPVYVYVPLFLTLYFFKFRFPCAEALSPKFPEILEKLKNSSSSEIKIKKNKRGGG